MLQGRDDLATFLNYLYAFLRQCYDIIIILVNALLNSLPHGNMINLKSEFLNHTNLIYQGIHSSFIEPVKKKMTILTQLFRNMMGEVHGSQKSTSISNPIDAKLVKSNSFKILQTAEKVSVGTYNILFPQIKLPPTEFSTSIGYSTNKEEELFDNIDFRLTIIKDNIKNANLDIVCLQEVTEKVANVIKENFSSDYHLIWAQHLNGFHGVAVLYKHKFTKLSSSTINVTIPAYDKKTGKNTFIKERSHLLVDLQDDISKKIFRVISCHLLDVRDQTDKKIHSKKVVDSAENISEKFHVDRIIIAGDMNQDQWRDRIKGKQIKQTDSDSTLLKSAVFEPMQSLNYHVDGSMEPSTFFKEGYGDNPIIKGRRRIDWIWSKHFSPTPIILPNFDNRASDHALVASMIC